MSFCVRDEGLFGWGDMVIVGEWDSQCGKWRRSPSWWQVMQRQLNKDQDQGDIVCERERHTM